MKKFIGSGIAAFALLLGWGPTAALVLAGITWISSSGNSGFTSLQLFTASGPKTARTSSVVRQVSQSVCGFVTRWINPHRPSRTIAANGPRWR